MISANLEWLVFASKTAPRITFKKVRDVGRNAYKLAQALTYYLSTCGSLKCLKYVSIFASSSVPTGQIVWKPPPPFCRLVPGWLPQVMAWLY